MRYSLNLSDVRAPLWFALAFTVVFMVAKVLA